ncbi:MAG TPA: CBS domain-containing protein [Gemmatimonadales bacterium]
MRVADLMQSEVETVPDDIRVTDALLTLADTRVSALPVLDRSGRLVGVISRTDILASEEEVGEETARNALFENTSVRDMMTAPALTIAPGASIREAAQQMLSAGVHRLVVTQGEQVVGIISVSDIIGAVAAGRL